MSYSTLTRKQSGMVRTSDSFSYRLNTSIRDRPAEDTLDIISTIYDDLGIDEVKNITLKGVECCPVYQVTRKTIRSVYFNAGKGFTEAESKVSGLMEAIEVQCFERADASLILSPSQFPNVCQVAATTTNDLSDGSVLGQDLVNDRDVLIPAVDTFMQLPDGKLANGSCNGIASGNSFAEAACHGLYEMIERHGIRLFLDSEFQCAVERIIAPSEEKNIQACIQSLKKLDIDAEFVLASVVADVPIFICFLDMPLQNGSRGAVQGYGANHNPLIAMSRALAEAIQVLALTPIKEDNINVKASGSISMTSKQASELTPESLYAQRLYYFQVLQLLRDRLPLVEYDYMSVDSVIQDEEDTPYLNEIECRSSLEQLQHIVQSLVKAGYSTVYACSISSKKLPVTVVKAFCPGLKSIPGL